MKQLSVEMLIQGYCQGIFPMGESDSDEINWYEPKIRGIIPIDSFKISKNTQRWIRNKPHKVKIDTCFEEVMKSCGKREETWINDEILNSYHELHDLGLAHSVEIFIDEKLVGGLYGVHLGKAFFGESMFHFAPETDKVALYYCHQILKKNNFTLWDTQFYTEHLGTFGCIKLPQKKYLKLLVNALDNTEKSNFKLI